MTQELKRKAFHSLILLIILSYVFLPLPVVFWGLGILWAAVGVTEAVRLRRPRVNDFLMRFFHGIDRETERTRPSGIFWTLSGALLVVGLIPYRDIAVTCLIYLLLGDMTAALVGQTWGHFRIGGKSLEGGLACFLVCWFAGALCLQPAGGMPEALIGALIATLCELLPLPFDDNLWIPWIPGITLSVLRIASVFR
ncbi:MAG TPA: hypothetical protein PK876_03860 [Elusimicrobiota bacterium]|nr:hypothetical protein [Elusimicrobiota bacterium]